MEKKDQTYAAAGVDIDAADRAKELIKKHARIAWRPEVLSDIGFFGSQFELKDYSQPVLISSTDGVGTKLKISTAMQKHDTIGIDLVNHCINDIFTCGAEPLFFLDYIAMGKLIPETVESLIQGVASACQDAGCALVGGETAEMPGVYAEGDYELIGFIVGVVEKDKRLDPKSIKIGDALLGLPSSGLHTNGYSLVRKIFGDKPSDLKVSYPELGRTLGEELLEPHRCYYTQLKPALPSIKGMAHITGGGLPGNVPRTLPPGLTARFNEGSWSVPPIFSLIQQRGGVSLPEMYRVFNMGVGMVVVCSPSSASEFMKLIPELKLIGEVVEQKGEERVVIV